MKDTLRTISSLLGVSPNRSPSTSGSILDEPFFHLGRATGRFSERRHLGAATQGDDLWLSLRDAAQGVICVGSPGEGKTSGLVGRLTLQALQHATIPGIFCPDIKGDFATTFERLAQLGGRSTTRIGIGPGAKGFNAIGTLSPSAVGAVISRYMSRGASGGDNAFFVNSSAQLLEASLALLKAQPDKYTLAEARRIPILADKRDDAIAAAKAEVQRVDDLLAAGMSVSPADMARRDEMAFGLSYFAEDFKGLQADKETYGNILSQLSTALSPFSRPQIERAFCDASTGALDLSSLYDGAAVVVTCATTEFPSVMEIVMTLLKEQFFALIRARSEMAKDDPRAQRPIVFLCDEYQAIASPRDAEFFALSRSQRLIPVVSMQQFESLSRIMSEADATLLIGNMSQKIGFTVGTPKTIAIFTDLLGEAEYVETTTTKGVSQHATHILPQISSSAADSNRTHKVVDGQMFRSLTNNYRTMQLEAIALLRVGGRAKDDIIQIDGLTV